MSEEEDISRREFLGKATWTIGGVIGLGLATPAVVYLVGPALAKTETQTWIRLGSAAKVELNTPTLFKFKIQRKSGWIVNEEEVSVYLLTKDGREFVAMSNICTHLGCRVRWVSEQKQFFCPCHSGVFDEEGKVQAGPPPRALDRFQVKVENDQLFVLGG